MAFSVKQIKALLSEHGLPVDNLEAAADEICRRHAADLDSIKEERDSYKKDAETLAATKKELEDLKAKPDDGWKDKYDAARKELAEYKETVAKEKTLAAKKAAYQELCKDAGLSENGIAKAVKYADFDSVEMDDAGKIKDGKSLIKSIREEWPEHIVKDSTSGARTATPPGGGSAGLKSREEIYKKDEHGRFVLDAAQRQQALSEIIAAEQQKG